MTKKLYKKLMHVATIESFNLISKNTSKCCLIILFDILLWVSIWGTNMLIKVIVMSLNMSEPIDFSSILFIILSILYYGLIILIYSFFKLGILDFIKSMQHKTKFYIKKLRKFFLLNLIILTMLYVFFILMAFFLSNVKESLFDAIVANLLAVFAILSYIFINLAHSIFYETVSIKKSIIEGIKFFETAKLYYILLQSIILISLFSIVFYFLIQSLPYLANVLMVVFILIMYAVFFVNRVSFYRIVKDRLFSINFK